MNGAPTVTVVVPVFNRAAELALCLEALARQSWPGTQMELIVVDNGSSDGSAEAARRGGARVFIEPRRGAPYARNRGIAESAGEWVAFIDSDCVADSGWLEALIAPLLADGKIGYCGGAVTPYSLESPLEQFIHRSEILNQEKFSRRTRFSLPFFMTANAAFRREALLQAASAAGGGGQGPFDPAMAPAEDADLCWRISDAGWESRYVPEAIVRHKHRSTLGSFARQVFGYGAGTVHLFRKHRQRFDARAHIEWRRYELTLRATARLMIKGWFLRGGEREWLMYSLVSHWAFAAGRLYGSLKNRTLFL
ncbi:MAG: glycosyltransferase [Candidatus Sumerlaeota bacterium]|nr:glycosyltransferase [Candidatus Sumerlaeota bacterium]